MEKTDELIRENGIYAHMVNLQVKSRNWAMEQSVDIDRERAVYLKNRKIWRILWGMMLYR